MDLTKKIELYYCQSPVRGDTQSMQESLDGLNEFCAIYSENDLPVDVHNKTGDHMSRQFGMKSQFAKAHGGQMVMPYTVNTQTGLASRPLNIEDINANTLKGSGFKQGGMFFNSDIAEAVIGEFEKLGYEIEKKYD